MTVNPLAGATAFAPVLVMMFAACVTAAAEAPASAPAAPDVAALRAAAEGGNLEAMNALGEALEKGHATRMDHKEALRWYQKAADAGNAVGMKNLGNFHQRGWGGLAADPGRAVEWYRKAADAGEPKGMVNLASMLMTGRGAPKDEAQAVALYRKAMERGEPAAIQALAGAYALGKGVAADADESQRLLRQAEAECLKRAEAGDTDAMLRLVGLYFNNPKLAPQPDAALVWNRKAADAGRTDAMRGMGYMHMNGLGGAAKDPAEAFKWELKAAENGERDSMLSIASMYEKGLGVAKDEQAAAAWREKAENAGK